MRRMTGRKFSLERVEGNSRSARLWDFMPILKEICRQKYLEIGVYLTLIFIMLKPTLNMKFYIIDDWQLFKKLQVIGAYSPIEQFRLFLAESYEIFTSKTINNLRYTPTRDFLLNLQMIVFKDHETLWALLNFLKTSVGLVVIWFIYRKLLQHFNMKETVAVLVFPIFILFFLLISKESIWGEITYQSFSSEGWIFPFFMLAIVFLLDYIFREKNNLTTLVMLTLVVMGFKEYMLSLGIAVIFSISRKLYRGVPKKSREIVGILVICSWGLYVGSKFIVSNSESGRDIYGNTTGISRIIEGTLNYFSTPFGLSILGCYIWIQFGTRLFRINSDLIVKVKDLRFAASCLMIVVLSDAIFHGINLNGRYYLTQIASLWILLLFVVSLVLFQMLQSEDCNKTRIVKGPEAIERLRFPIILVVAISAFVIQSNSQGSFTSQINRTVLFYESLQDFEKSSKDEELNVWVVSSSDSWDHESILSLGYFLINRVPELKLAVDYTGDVNSEAGLRRELAKSLIATSMYGSEDGNFDPLDKVSSEKNIGCISFSESYNFGNKLECSSVLVVRRW